jgi:hypothetical protein
VTNDDDRGHDLLLDGHSNNWKETGNWASYCCAGNHESFICPEPQPVLAGWNNINQEDNLKSCPITTFHTDEVEIFKLIDLKRKIR